MIGKWDKAAAETDYCELDVWPYLTTLTADAISRAAFGSNYEEGQRIFELLREQIRLMAQILQSVYVPGLRYIPTPRNRRFTKLEAQIHASLRGIIDKRRRAVEGGESTKPDLLGILMDSNLKDETQQLSGGSNKLKNQRIRLSMRDVMDECKAFYIGGQETTSVLLVWTLLLLSKHQDWQARAREEVQRMFGSNVPTFEGLNHLNIVTMILHEVLRLYPPAPQLSRRVFKETTLGDLSLPANALLNIQVLVAHRDKDVWGDDAEEFRPDRFAEGIAKATRGNTAFFPFGWGPRICMGEKFAITEAKMALSMILRRFSLELSPSYAHAPMTVFTLQPQFGAQIILHKL